MAEAHPDAAGVEALIAEVAGGDQRAFAALYDATSSYVFGLLIRLLRSRPRAEEVAQEVYLEIWRRAASFDPGRGSGMSWIGLLARSRAIDRIRADDSYRDAVAGLSGGPGDHPLGEPPDDPETGALDAERRELVRRALRELPTEQRRALESAFFEGYTHREIAGRTGTPLGTVKSRIRAALEKLESALAPRLGGEGRG